MYDKMNRVHHTRICMCHRLTNIQHEANSRSVVQTSNVWFVLVSFDIRVRTDLLTNLKGRTLSAVFGWSVFSRRGTISMKNVGVLNAKYQFTQV